MTCVGSFAEGASRVRRQTAGNGLNGTALCPGGLDLNAAYQICPEPKSKCKTNLSCLKTVKCNNKRGRRSLWGWGVFSDRRFRPYRRSRRSGCWNEHTIRLVTVCCEYICDNNGGSSNNGTAEILERLLWSDLFSIVLDHYLALKGRTGRGSFCESWFFIFCFKTWNYRGFHFLPERFDLLHSRKPRLPLNEYRDFLIRINWNVTI